MYLAEASRYARQSAQLRFQIRKRGYTTLGYPLWTAEEDEICRQLYPDYSALQKALPRRSKCAIKSRCCNLGIVRKVHVWTAAELAKFKRLYKSASTDEILTTFPHLSKDTMWSMAGFYKVGRPKQPYARTGNYLLDGLRDECKRQGITMPELDEFVGSKRYFRWKGWSGSRGSIKYGHIVRGIHELGGRLEIKWSGE